MQIYHILFSTQGEFRLAALIVPLFFIYCLAGCSKDSSGQQTPPPHDSVQTDGPEAPEIQETPPVEEDISSLKEFEYDTLQTEIPRFADYMPNVNVGAEVLIHRRLKELQGKKIGIVANHTSRVFGGVHLVDTLVASGIEVIRVFAPEHGFRGTADAGETVKSGIDRKTGLPVLSLYGKNKKPSASMLEGIELMIFDIQDVGTRFYTYISTMAYVMEACAEVNIPFMVLDRPNPNGNYVDGPVLDPQYQSFIGLHPIPIVHGMTIGEYAQMVNGEGWLKGEIAVDLTVVPVEKYSHSMTWDQTGLPWVAPSPNLATEYAAYLYAAICWFEPTDISVGRGTDDAFTMIGAPWFQGTNFFTARTAGNPTAQLYGLGIEAIKFLPRSLPGKSKYPKHQDKLCTGLKFSGRTTGKDLFLAGIRLFQAAYIESQSASLPKGFFRKGFEKWPGNSSFRTQIESGSTPEEIYDSWQEQTDEFREIRKRYLMYPDF